MPGHMRGVYSFLEDWKGTGVCREGRWGPAFACCSGRWTQVVKAKGSTTNETARNILVRTDEGGRVAIQSGGEAICNPTFQGPFELSHVAIPADLLSFHP